MGQKEELIKLIGQTEYTALESQIPDKIKQDIVVNFSDYLLGKTEQQILDFYLELINSNNQWTLPKIAGSIVILTSHINDLLVKLVETREKDIKIKETAKNFDLHYLILFCTARYNLPKDHFIQMMELKHFRNMVAHDFNSIMETSFNQAIHPIAKAHLLIIVLTQMIKEVKND